ncbi:MAG TPA: transcription elongation factor GreA [Bacilli bacterium]|nr:transcription elongation factor GreA [Bacilli bacterium]
MKPKKEVILTAEGYLELEAELNNLKIVRRPEIIKSLKEARAQGDLSENADYDAAREEQAHLEARIKELEYKLEHCKVVDKVNTDKVDIGNLVTVEYLASAEQEVYKVVGSEEVDPFENEISNESPIGAAIMGHKINEVVDVISPNGDYQIKIIKIA